MCRRTIRDNVRVEEAVDVEALRVVGQVCEAKVAREDDD